MLAFAIFATLANAPATAQTVAQPLPPEPDAERIVMLIRNTLLTLNDALETGNFTVLRDLSAPGFRDANSAVRLGFIFENLARSGIDLSPAATLAPQLSDTPTINPQSGMLHIKGTFADQRLPIGFEMLYQPVGSRWRIFGLSVQPLAIAPQVGAADANVQPVAPEIPAKAEKSDD